jgi:hypothetical protein
MIFDIISTKDVQTLVQDWQKRSVSSLDDGYKIALEECIHEIKDLIKKAEEEKEKEALAEFDAYENSLNSDEEARLAEYYKEQEEEANLLLLGEA